MILLKTVVSHLDRLEIRHCLIGAAALAAHGVSRATLDLDLLTTDSRAVRSDTWEGLRGETLRIDVRQGDLDEDTKLKRPVALKVLPQEVASDPVRLERFQREAEAVAALNHPHIVTIFCVEEAEGVHFFTMELGEGKSLDRLIPKGGLKLERFFELAIPLADALSEAHERGITHRDLKPARQRPALVI